MSASQPPKVGEYAYFHAPQPSDTIESRSIPIYRCSLQGEEKELYAHYSLSVKLIAEPWVTCHGIIKKVYSETY